MAAFTKRADRFIEKIFGARRAVPVAQGKPTPPQSVKARLDDARTTRVASGRKMRQLRMF